jgi:hypothetical protein
MPQAKQLTPIDFSRANEQLRQESESFNQIKRQNSLWFFLRLIMGYISILIILIVLIICIYVLLNNKQYDANAVLTSFITILVDIIGLMINVWKIVLNPQTFKQIEPVTRL